MSFDKVAAVYVFCMNYHEGQFSRLYRLMSRIVRQYNIKLTDDAIRSIECLPDETPSPEWFFANIIYLDLVEKYGK